MFSVSPLSNSCRNTNLLAQQIDTSTESSKILQQTTKGIDFAGNERFFCPNCSVKYTKIKFLKSHMKLCGRKFVCEFCQNSYKQKRSYALHVKQKHANEILYFDISLDGDNPKTTTINNN